MTHVEGEVDPVRDLAIISEELRLKDEENLMKYLDKLEKLVTRGGDKKIKPEYVSAIPWLYETCMQHCMARDLDLARPIKIGIEQKKR